MSQNLEKKLRALSQLENIGDFDAFISEQIEIAVENRIINFINVTSPKYSDVHTPSSWNPPTLREAGDPAPVHQIKTTHSGGYVSYNPEEAELSHEDAIYDNDEEATPEPQPVASVHVGGLTVESILSDSDVEDSNTEAVGEAGEGVGFEHLIPQPAPQPAYVPAPIQPPPQVKTPRPYAKKPPKMNAKVHEMTDIGEAQRSGF